MCSEIQSYAMLFACQPKYKSVSLDCRGMLKIEIIDKKGQTRKFFCGAKKMLNKLCPDGEDWGLPLEKRAKLENAGEIP